jgi:squalene-associated FAD-dependent desaturase
MRALRGLNPDDPAADARSFGDWLTEHRQDEETVQTIWALIARPTLNLIPADASLAQAAFVFQEGLLRDAAAGDIGHARVPLGKIHDVAARRALAAAGVDVRLRRGATAIVPEANGFRIEISSAPVLAADAVVLAVPHERAALLLPPGSGLDHARLAALGSSPIVNLHVAYDRRVLDVPFAAAVGTPVQWVFDRTESSGVSHGQLLAVSLSAADAELMMTVDQLRARYLPALAELLPAAGEARVETFFVTREHAATFRAAPGARALRPGPTTDIAGLVVAGAWTDTGWPATMEGAVRSGRTAARAALAIPAGRPEVRAAVAV